MPEDKLPKVLRPHERRSQQATLSTTEDDPFGSITPPSLETLEAVEAAFPVTLPDPGAGDLAVHTYGRVQRQLGQQDVIQFLRNLRDKPTQQGAS